MNGPPGQRMGNAAVGIARVVTHHLGIPAALVADLAGAEEVSHRVRVRPDSRLANRSLDDVELPIQVGMRVVAIRRGREWLIDPDGRETDISNQPMHMRAVEGLGYLAQETSVFRRLSVADNIKLIWEQRGVTRDDASTAGVASGVGSGGRGMDCWIVIGCGNYKISRSGPIALPPEPTFSPVVPGQARDDVLRQPEQATSLAPAVD